ncbi:MAG: hypothetical protein Q4P32_02855 [Micrococcales bacterium]|nr:hypothetical protein [Micrococcales bacterium]
MGADDADWFERFVLDPASPIEHSDQHEDWPAAPEGDSGPPTVEIPVPVDTPEGPLVRVDPETPAEPEAPSGRDQVEDAGWSDYGDIVDTSAVSLEEMTGVWLTTETDRESPLRMDGQLIEPEELDLPPDVCDRLRDWSDQWRAEWDPDRGWDPCARIGDFEALGHWLARRVKDGAGALEVTLHLAHLGHSGIEVVQEPARRRPMIVTLAHVFGARLPVRGDFVTAAGVGSFSSELNGRLEAWADGVQAHLDALGRWDDPVAAQEFADQADDLADAMEEELGPDYVVEIEQRKQ